MSTQLRQALLVVRTAQRVDVMTYFVLIDYTDGGKTRPPSSERVYSNDCGCSHASWRTPLRELQFSSVQFSSCKESALEVRKK